MVRGSNVNLEKKQTGSGGNRLGHTSGSKMEHKKRKKKKIVKIHGTGNEVKSLSLLLTGYIEAKISLKDLGYYGSPQLPPFCSCLQFLLLSFPVFVQTSI